MSEPSVALLALVRTLALRVPRPTPLAVQLAVAALREEDPDAYALVMAITARHLEDHRTPPPCRYCGHDLSTHNGPYCMEPPMQAERRLIEP